MQILADEWLNISVPPHYFLIKFSLQCLSEKHLRTANWRTKARFFSHEYSVRMIYMNLT